MDLEWTVLQIDVPLQEALNSAQFERHFCAHGSRRFPLPQPQSTALAGRLRHRSWQPVTLC